MRRVTMYLPDDERLVEQVEQFAVRRCQARGVWWRKRFRKLRRTVRLAVLFSLAVALAVAALKMET